MRAASGRARLALSLALLLTVAGCGDDQGAPPDGARDGLPPGADASAGGVGAPCDQSQHGAECALGPGATCLSDQYLLCRPGFCSRVCSDADPCPGGSVCARLPIVGSDGQPTTLALCFLPCDTATDTCGPVGLGCDLERGLCDDGVYLWNVGTLGARQAGGQACVGSPPPPQATLFGANVPASDPTLSRPSEPHLAADPTNPDLLYIAYNAGGGTFVSVSADGGRSFVHHDIKGGVDPLDRGDPVLAVEPSTHEIWHAFLTDLSGQCAPGAGYRGDNAIHLVHSADRGATWSAPLGASDPAYTSPDYLHDKPWLVIAPDGTIYVSYSRYETASGRSDVLLASSHDRGASFRNVVVNDSGGGSGALTGLVTDAQSRLTMIWRGYGVAGTVLLARSTDGGATVTHPNIVVTSADNASGDDPQIAVSPDGARLYAVYGLDGAFPNSNDVEDVVAQLSLDGGTTWLPPVRINEDDTCATHWHPTAVADPAGDLWITYYDERYGDARVRWVRATVQAGALAIVDRGWVTDAAPPFTTSRTHEFLGDYMGLAVSGGRLYAAWGDLRELAGGGGVRIYFSSALLP